MSFPIQMQVTRNGVVTMSMQQALTWQDAGLKLREFDMEETQRNGAYVKVGSPKPKLHSEAVAIYTICKQYQIHLESEWIPKEFNQEADELSRLATKDDYMLNLNIFAALDILWGPHTIDCFSIFWTHQVPCFCSCWWNPCTEGVDAFTLDWPEENN